MSTDAYLFATCPTVGEDLDPSRLRGYAIADVGARFRRARGEEVLFTLGFDTFGTTPKPPEGQDAEQWLAERCAAVRAQLDRLGISLDWDRALLTSDPAVYRWSQWLFVKLLEAGLVYQRGGKGWFLRTSDFNAENDRRLDELEGWSDAARDAQHELLRRVDGFELEAQALDGTALTLFTAHPDAVGSAEFVGLSPARPEIDAWVAEDEGLHRRVDELRTTDWSETAPGELPVVEIGMSAQVPGVPQPLPIVVSPAIDARYGQAAIVGIPSADPGDKVLAKGLPKLGGLAWKVDAKPAKTKPAVRFLAPDMPLSRGRAWGAPLPAVHCEACGAVPVPLDQLPLELPEGLDVTGRGNLLAGAPGFADCECPSCGGKAQRDPGTLHPRLGAAWIELALAVPPADRGERMLDHPDLERWLPTARTVEDAAANVALLDMRTVAKALRDAGALEFLATGEPHGPTLSHERFELTGDRPSTNGGDPVKAAAPVSVGADDVSPGGAGAADDRDAVAALIDAHGADAVRFALLYAAAPGKAYSGSDSVVRQSAAFLAELRAFAQPRLDGATAAPVFAAPGDTDKATDAIDHGDGLRRRLAGWCDTAVAKVTENYERLDTHRATRNVMELLARLQDFERRVVEHRGEVAGADRAAVSIALGILVGLLAPLAPELAAELQREPAAA